MGDFIWSLVWFVGIGATFYYFWEMVHKTRYKRKEIKFKGEENKVSAKLGTAFWIIFGFGFLLVMLSAIFNT